MSEAITTSIRSRTAGLSSGDFVLALGQFLGSTAGLSALVITKLTETWKAEQRASRSGIYRSGLGLPVGRRHPCQHPPGGARLCLLVMIGVRADGRKELVALTDGYRESAESWADLLRDCARRGMVRRSWRWAMARSGSGARCGRCCEHARSALWFQIATFSVYRSRRIRKAACARPAGVVALPRRSSRELPLYASLRAVVRSSHNRRRCTATARQYVDRAASTNVTPTARRAIRMKTVATATMSGPQDRLGVCWITPGGPILLPQVRDADARDLLRVCISVHTASAACAPAREPWADSRGLGL